MVAHSKLTRVYLDEHDISGVLTGFDHSPEHQLVEATVFTDTARKHSRGLGEETWSLESLFDSGDDGDAAIVALRSGSGLMTLWPGGDAIEKVGVSGSAVQASNYSGGVRVGELVAFRAQGQWEQVTDRLVSLGTESTVTSTTAGTSIDDGGASADGGVFVVHVLAFSATGGNAQWVIDLEESDDDGALDDFAAVDSITFSAVGAERSTFAGAFEQYVRVKATLDASSGSITYQAGYVRN
jgi:hypothetical protein